MNLFNECREMGMSKSEAVKEISSRHGIAKNQLYEIVHKTDIWKDPC
jgi:hypothetical protein